MACSALCVWAKLHVTFLTTKQVQVFGHRTHAPVAVSLETSLSIKNCPSDVPPEG